MLPLFFDWLTKVYERALEDFPKMTADRLSDHSLFTPGESGAEGLIKFIIIKNNNKTFLTSLPNNDFIATRQHIRTKKKDEESIIRMTTVTLKPSSLPVCELNVNFIQSGLSRKWRCP